MDSQPLAVVRSHLLDPYPEDVFTPLSDAELGRCVAALRNCGVPAASDRLHAGWARHLFYGIAAAGDRDA